MELTAAEVEELAPTGYLAHLLPKEIENALQEKDSEGSSLLLKLTKQGIPFDKYPNGSLSYRDITTTNNAGESPLSITLKHSHSPQGQQNLHTLLCSLPQKDAGKVLAKASKTTKPTQKTYKPNPPGFEL